MSSPTVIWFSVAGFDGTLTWIPEDLNAAPANCVCGALLQTTELAIADQRPIELTCDRGHRWRGAIDVLEARLAVKRPDRPRCARCGEFLSAARVEMRIDRCAICDNGPRRKSAR